MSLYIEVSPKLQLSGTFSYRLGAWLKFCMRSAYSLLLKMFADFLPLMRPPCLASPSNHGVVIPPLAQFQVNLSLRVRAVQSARKINLQLISTYFVTQL
jgi:hypothetical protein